MIVGKFKIKRKPLFEKNSYEVGGFFSNMKITNFPLPLGHELFFRGGENAFKHRVWDSPKYYLLNSTLLFSQKMTTESLSHYFKASAYRLTALCLDILLVDQLGSSCGCAWLPFRGCLPEDHTPLRPRKMVGPGLVFVFVHSTALRPSSPHPKHHLLLSAHSRFADRCLSHWQC